MKKEKGLAYCGLSCCVCSKNENCAGCRNDGCMDKDWCKYLRCCKEKDFCGCWECESFPCGDMHDKLRIRAFVKFIQRYGENELIECLERNEKSGIVYHYDGQFIGDYDKPQTEEEIIKILQYG